MGFLYTIAKRAAASKKSTFIGTVRDGWNSYSFIFYIGGISAILGGTFGMAGWLSTLVTVAFFYYAGRFRNYYDAEKAKIEKRNKLRKNG